jgi:16S rRNA (cytosine967-C5)-methyltransferase
MNEGRKRRDRDRPREEPAGRPARRLALFAVDAVLTRRQGLDEAFEAGLSKLNLGDMVPRDRAFARAISLATLRRRGRLQAVIDRFLEKPLPETCGRLPALLLTAAAQVLLLDTPAHAVLSQSVDIIRLDREATRFDRLVNAVLRRVAAQGPALLSEMHDPQPDIPAWLWARWRAAYGIDAARAIADASLTEPALDVSVAGDAAQWAKRLGGYVLPTGSVRLLDVSGRIEALAGFTEGAWWVQDAAAALPVRLLGPVGGRRVADVCAAPGGKTLQLVAAGAHVTAVDASAKRMQRVADNLARIDREARLVTADVMAWAAAERDPFDAVLLDAPCSATGTIRRHPDLLWTKPETEIARLATRQRELLTAAAPLVKPGGILVVATCSLEPEEGPAMVRAFLDAHPAFVPEPARAGYADLPPHLETADGFLRTRPDLAFGDDPIARGMDGFFAARLRRRS